MDQVETKLTGFLEILQQFKTVVASKSAPADENGDRVDKPVNALADIASVCHAHTVKIGIAFKPPISDQAALQCLDDTMKLIPAFTAAYNGMTDVLDSRMMRLECQSRLVHLFTELIALTQHLISLTEKLRNSDTVDRDTTLAYVNKVLNQCKSIEELKRLGPSGIAAAKLEMHQAVLKDAGDELKDWIENPDDDFGFDDFGDDEDATDEPEERPQELVELAEAWKDKLIKLQFLIKAVRTKRVKLLDVNKLDQVVDQCDKLCASVDDLVSGLQLGEDRDSIDTEPIQQNASKLLDIAHVEVEQEDQYVKWVDLFRKSFF